jgi:hypothetical protein
MQLDDPRPRENACRDPGTRPELRILDAAAQMRIVSAARIRLDSRKSVRPFKEIISGDVSEFEPHMPRQAVRSLNLRIAGIQRDGQGEEFESLSGGTQEQLAVLTRLAFAELLLGQGRPATVILDDALAFSDDERIESMFDVLMRAGERVQIIILTCRKRLFTRLGAVPLEITRLGEA